MLKSGAMFEVRIQTYWADADPAGIVFFPNFFKFIEQAEEEMFRSRGVERHEIMEQHQVWFPRVEAFSKYTAPIRHGEAIRVQMTTTIKSSKSVRYDFDILGAADGKPLAGGYIVIVCVDRENFKSTPIPEAMRRLFTELSQA